MNDPMKRILVHERAVHFFRETVVGSMEGVFFVLISALFMVIPSLQVFRFSRSF